MSNLHAGEFSAAERLRMAAMVVAVVCGWTVLGGIANAQTKTAAGASPVFEVASVKPSIADRTAAATKRSWGDVTGRVTLVHIPLQYLLLQVYDLQPNQLSGPTWLESEFFDIFAVVPAGAPKKQIPLMFQALLAERFKLKFHRETQVAQVYALVVGKGGPKLKESMPDDTDVAPSMKLTGNGEKTSISGTDTGPFGRAKLTFANGFVHGEFASITMRALAEFLSQGGKFDLPVVDMTGLRGSYQVPLDYSMSEMSLATGRQPADQVNADQPVPKASDPSGVSLRESLQKLGLKLERRRLPNEKFVIDHVERTPTPN